MRDMFLAALNSMLPNDLIATDDRSGHTGPNDGFTVVVTSRPGSPETDPGVFAVGSGYAGYITDLSPHEHNTRTEIFGVYPEL